MTSHFAARTLTDFLAKARLLDRVSTNPHLHRRPSSLPALPIIDIRPRSVRLRSGEQLRLQCAAYGSQPITVEWTKVGGALSPTAAVDRSGVLTIPRVSPQDNGQYRCTAVNSAGRADKVIEVNVVGEWTLADSPPPPYQYAVG